PVPRRRRARRPRRDRIGLPDRHAVSRPRDGPRVRSPARARSHRRRGSAPHAGRAGGDVSAPGRRRVPRVPRGVDEARGRAVAPRGRGRSARRPRSPRAASVIIAIDGAIVAPEQATISVLDRGLLYGDGAFEILRTWGGRAVELE